MTTKVSRKVDLTGLKVGQAITIILLILGFVLNTWILVAFVGIAQLLGALGLPFAPYKLIYTTLIKPSGLVKSNVQPDNPEPHRFAMLVGAIFNGMATLLLFANVPIVAWALVWIVIALANLNFWLNFCLGCWVYYRLNRYGVRGFVRSPLQ